MIAYNKNGIQLKFDFIKQPGVPNVTVINATFINSTPVPLINFVLQAAVPPVCLSPSPSPFFPLFVSRSLLTC